MWGEVMFKYKKIPKEDLEKIIRNASQRLNINEAVIEKDYWVCFILNYIFSQCKWKNAFTFKGGTSLSKCFGLIKRFSEDIDLILDWRIIGYEMMNLGNIVQIPSRINLTKNQIKEQKIF